MTKSKILKRLAEFGPPLIAKTTKPGPYCVLSCAVGQLALAKFGLVAEPYVAEVTICNAAWVAWTKEDRAGGMDAALERGAYLMSNRPNFTGGTLPSMIPPTSAAWDGHLALRCGRFLIDLALGAFTRPTKNIWLPPSFVAPIGEDGSVEGEFHVDHHVTLVRYVPLVAPYADDYLTSKDWTLRDRYEDRVAALVKKIREGE